MAKKEKKAVAMLLEFCMALSLNVTAFAVGSIDGDAVIPVYDEIDGEIVDKIGVFDDLYMTEYEEIGDISEWEITENGELRYVGSAEKSKPLPEYPYRWKDNSVVGILERIEYTGCTCNFKTYSKSFKLKKRLPNDPENMYILEDTQEAIITKVQWDRVQELRKNKRRPAKAERQGLFSGLLFCADYGNKLHFATCKSFEGKQDHYVCSSYKSNRGTCSAHYIREDTLRDLILELR